MNSRNLSRFHKFSGSNFKKKNNINRNPAPLVSEQFANSNPEKNYIRKKIKIKNKKIKFFSKLYTEFLSVPLFLGSEDGSYFTILTLSIYNCQKKMGLMQKAPGGIPKRKPNLLSQVATSG